MGKTKMSEKSAQVTRSSGNVYEDLGFPDAGTELAKAELASKIASIIEDRGLNQTQAAKVLGIDQPKVSDLVRGKLRPFSVERLFRFLNALDRDIEVVVRPTRRSGHATVRVMAGKRSGTRG